MHEMTIKETNYSSMSLTVPDLSPQPCFEHSYMSLTVPDISPQPCLNIWFTVARNLIATPTCKTNKVNQRSSFIQSQNISPKPWSEQNYARNLTAPSYKREKTHKVTQHRSFSQSQIFHCGPDRTELYKSPHCRHRYIFNPAKEQEQ